MDDFFCVVPARENSKRLPRKLLLKLFGREVLIHTVSSCIRSRAKKVFVATDSDRIKNTVLRFKDSLPRNLAEKLDVFVVRGKDIKSGSDRVGKLIQILKQEGVKIPGIVVNVQGDEPLITPHIINSVVLSLARDKRADIATYGFWSSEKTEYMNPNRVKIVVDPQGFAIYFSRSQIPFGAEKYILHAGIYAFRTDALFKFLKMKQTENEKKEKLEQLRAIDNGMKIKVFVGSKKLIPVDTHQDIKTIIKSAKLD